MKLPQRKVLLTVLGGLAPALFLAVACGGPQPAGTPVSEAVRQKLPDELFAAHYVDSYPKHGDVFAQVPDRVQIDFNFTLHEVSSIRVTNDGVPLEEGKVTLGQRNLSMWMALQAAAGDGTYVVNYRACWPDRSCHEGRFAFTVDRRTRATYLDLSGKKEARVEMQDLKFQPSHIIISQGTTVTWTNRDGVLHFVNTDPHPSHNVLQGLNSLDLTTGQSYNYVFTEPGEWGYHCSAHFPQGMIGRIIVKP